MNQTLTLAPWITFCHQLKGLPGHIKFSKEIEGEQCQIIAILGVQRDQLQLISTFELTQKIQDETVLAYLSQEVTISNSKFKIVYIPPNKNQHESLQYLSDILRDLSAVVVSDVNCGINRMKEKYQGSTKHFTVVNQRDIYEVGVGLQKIQLVRKIDTPLLGSLCFQGCKDRNVDFDVFEGALESNAKYWQLLLGGEKSWSFLNISTLEYYKIQRQLSRESKEIAKMRQEGQMLSQTQLELLHQHLLQKIETESAYQLAIVRDTVKTIMRQVRQQNSKNEAKFLKNLQNELLEESISQFEALTIKRGQIEEKLEFFNIKPEYTEFVLYGKENQLFKDEISRLYSQKQQMIEEIQGLKQQLAQKKSQIGQFKNELQVYSSKLATLITLEQNLQQRQELLDNFQYTNRKLREQLDHYICQNKQQKGRIEKLDEEVEEKQKEGKGMLQCLQEFTQQNVDLHSKVDTLTAELQELKNAQELANSIERRALCSIQNEAEIKTRLQRYQNYVNELKIGINSFKKLECQKFNYILQQNHQKYKDLQLQLTTTQNELKISQKANKQLWDSLKHQKHRMDYYQKFINAGCSNDPIAQCFEQNSATDRQRLILQ